MGENFPNNAFIQDDIQKQIDAIKEYTQSFKEKHSDIFANDNDDIFIEFKWDFLPKQENAKSKISFDIQFSDKLPTEIKNEFENYLAQFKY
jgi:hypothetical protein